MTPLAITRRFRLPVLAGLLVSCAADPFNPPRDERDGAASDAAPSTTGGAPVPSMPVLTALAPPGGAPGAAVLVEVSGMEFEAGAVVSVGGRAVVTTRRSDRTLQAQLPAGLTGQPGEYPVWVENQRGALIARSNVLAFSVRSAAAGPEIVDYAPDNGLAGDSVSILGRNLGGDSLKISDPGGLTAAVAAVGTAVWSNETLERLSFVIPAGWQTGPMAITSARGTARGKVFTVGRNLALRATVRASTEYGGTWTTARGADNDLATSWFAAAGNCVSLGPPACRAPPWFLISFAAPQAVGRLAIRGNREYLLGYGFLRGRFEVLDAIGGTLWAASLDLSAAGRDFDLVLPVAIPGASSVRFTGETDESASPGFAELQVFGP